MNLLALDSISDRTGAVILSEDGARFASLDEGEERRDFGVPRLEPVAHLRRILEEWGGDPARLDAAAVIVGPGSYTGLRSGLAALGGLFFGRSIRVAEIGTFEALRVASPDPAAIPVVRMRRTEWVVQSDREPLSIDAAGLEKLIGGRAVVALGALPDGHGARLLARTMSLADAAARLGLERATRETPVAIESVRPRYLGSYGKSGHSPFF